VRREAPVAYTNPGRLVHTHDFGSYSFANTPLRGATSAALFASSACAQQQRSTKHNTTKGDQDAMFESFMHTKANEDAAQSPPQQQPLQVTSAKSTATEKTQRQTAGAVQTGRQEDNRNSNLEQQT
jgi:hypothetical protein